MARSRAVRRPVTPPVNVAPPTLKTSLLFLLIALYLGASVFKLCVQEWNLYQQGRVLQAERAEVVAQSQALQAEIARTRTNAGIEQLAREQLGLVMAAEIPVKTVQAPPVTPNHKMPETAPETAMAKKTPVTLPPAMAALAKLFTPPW